MTVENLLAESLDMLADLSGRRRIIPDDVVQVIKETINKHHVGNTLEAKSRMNVATTLLQNLRVIRFRTDGFVVVTTRRIRQLQDLMAEWRDEDVKEEMEAARQRAEREAGKKKGEKKTTPPWLLDGGLDENDYVKFGDES